MWCEPVVDAIRNYMCAKYISKENWLIGNDVPDRFFGETATAHACIIWIISRRGRGRNNFFLLSLCWKSGRRHWNVILQLYIAHAIKENSVSLTSLLNQQFIYSWASCHASSLVSHITALKPDNLLTVVTRPAYSPNHFTGGVLRMCNVTILPFFFSFT